MWQNWQWCLLSHLSVDNWQCGGPSNWKQEARPFSCLSYPDCTIAVKTCISNGPVGWDPPVLINPVLIHIIWFRLVSARFLFHALVELSFLENCRVGGSLWGRMGADLDWDVLVCLGLVSRLVLVVCRLVLVNSGLLYWDLFNRAVVLQRQIHLILVLRPPPSAFR